MTTFCKVLEDAEERAVIESAISYLRSDFQKFWDWLDAAVKLNDARERFCQKP